MSRSSPPAFCARRKADRIRRELAELEGREWRTFEDSLRILVTLGAVVADKDDPSRLTATPLGEVAREVRCENELWMALALREASGMSLTPAELAGLVGALVGWDVVGSRPGVSCAYEPSPAVAAAMEALEGPRGDLEAVQIASGHMGASAAVVIDARLCGLVEVRQRSVCFACRAGAERA